MKSRDLRISKIANDLPPSGIREFFDLVLGMKDVISLGVGEPDFVTPWNIREAGIFSIEGGQTSYTSNKGMMKLRLCIKRHVKNLCDIRYDANNQILITTGVSEGLDLAFRAILNRGDNVLIPTPSYVAYAPLVYLCGAKAKIIRTDFHDGFKLKPEMIENFADSKTKAIVLNYPNNPTGTSYTKNELQALARVIKKRAMIVISDEVYSQLSFDFKHTPFASLPAMKERTIYLNGFSKGYAMTGWRVGYACGPVDIIGAMTKIHQYSMLCAPIMSQLAAVEALENSKNSLDEMCREYRRRREFVFKGLNELGLSCHRPQGAFYIFASVKKTHLSCTEFAKRLLKEEKVAVVPGIAFGNGLDSFIRIAYAAKFSDLKEALSRIAHFLKKHRR
ncbi:MAG: aminotransferase class I/II-fold pyridoxal phosphate-dependent enzyme [Candidatus Omnitrophica bacterium]|nr:aminotransferase class I/II-fold pyridoxal phosphate-dependent enzyme [Candidatus Omnitrophota bacterium]